MDSEESDIREVICPNCQGRVEIRGEAPSCGLCGAPLQGVTPIGAPPPELESDAPEEPPAPAKPAETVLICPNCANRQEPDPEARYCDECGGSLEGVAPAPGPLEPTEPTVESLPTDGACPACGGPVAVLSDDRGVCRKCGEKLETPEARARRRWGFLLVLLLAAAWLAVHFINRPYRY